MEELKAMHARRLWLDATSIVGLLGAVVFATWTVGQERNDLITRMTVLEADVASIKSSMATITRHIQGRWTRTDVENYLRRFCYDAERVNGNNFKCPPIVSPAPPNYMPGDPQ